jgi:diguanylate cyclase (GGDEF)-like protein
VTATGTRSGRGLRALALHEERRLAGLVAGGLYATGATTATAILLLPGVPKDHWRTILALAVFGIVWGAACLTAIPWERAHPLVSHLSSAMGFPITALAVAATGGASSPARYYLLFIVVYCSYFYPPSEAIPYLLGCVTVYALPVLYDRGAVDEGFVADLAVMAPTFLVIGGLIIAGKRLLVDLRDRADELARCDPLTGLANRRAFVDALTAQHGGRRADDVFGLLLVDLDGFKDANTLYGFPAGDEVLREAAAALRSTARAADLVARLGGDEFALLIRGASEQGMQSRASRVLDALRAADERLELSGFRLSGSVGWALYPQDAETGDELVAAADLALRGAKATGKDRALSPLDWLPETADV